MQPIKLTVRCMAWCERGQWVAACIDLTLAAQASSLNEAKRKLHGQIFSYVNEAMTIDQRHAEQLLSRRAPLRDRLRYAFWVGVKNRPRLRHAVNVAIAQVGLAISRKLAYSEPLPLRPA